MIDRAILLSHNKFQNANLQLIKTTLINNSYPLYYINKIIKERLIYLKTKQSVSTIDSNNTNNNNNSSIGSNTLNNCYIKLPYHSQLVKPITCLLKPLNIIPAWTSLDSTQHLFSQLKDKDDNNLTSNIVYEVSCTNCSAVYIGETKQYLHKRLYQHSYNIRQGNCLHSALCQHAISQQHVFDFENPKSLHKCTQYYKRLILEALSISYNPLSINTQTEVDGVIYNYKYIF